MVIAGVGYGAYKLTQPQAEQIEQDTGKKLEDLNEEEIEKSMDKLGIKAQEPTEAEMAQLDAGDASASSPAPAASSTGSAGVSEAAAPMASSSDSSYLDELEKLAQLRDQGVITDEEFETKKKQLLGL